MGSIPTVSTVNKINFRTIEQYFVNDAIERGLRWANRPTDKIRLVGSDGQQLGVFDLNQAMAKAKEEGLDLVLITAKANPPVCRIIEAGKFLYQKKKEQKRSATVEMKKIKIRFNTSVHDMETQIRKAKKFLEKGDRLQIIMMLRGRENALRDQAEKKINEFLEMLKSTHSVKTENRTSKKSKMLQYEVTSENIK